LCHGWAMHVYDWHVLHRLAAHSADLGGLDGSRPWERLYLLLLLYWHGGLWWSCAVYVFFHV
jgi:hypothetical protein